MDVINSALLLLGPNPDESQLKKIRFDFYFDRNNWVTGYVSDETSVMNHVPIFDRHGDVNYVINPELLTWIKINNVYDGD